jgi:choline/glycine/proline betaine transport protein
VFFPSAALIILLVGLSAVSPTTAKYFLSIKDFIVQSFGWLFTISVNFFLVFCVALGLSHYGKLRLGPDDSRPEYSTLSWFSMLFSAGMGIGLMFFSVAEPMHHYASPPIGDATTAAAARTAMGVTFFHWGLHAWAVYIVLGLSLAYFAYRHQLPLSVRSVFKPLLGERIHGAPGHLIDLLAVFGTVFGLATSLGLGAKQINSGLNYLFGVSESVGSQVVIISLVTLAATASLLSGVSRGIRRLSEVNLCIAALLLVTVFFIGPTLFVLNRLPHDLAAYARQIGESFVFGDGLGSPEWQESWTIFYWAWWISWAPFVGTFVARISRGRTIREFIVGVLLVPTLLTIVWLGVFGETAIYLERFQDGGIGKAVSENSAVAIYKVLELLPAAQVTSFIAMVTVVLFFVTSSDSGSFVVDMLTSGGHPNPPMWQRIFWALTEGAVAIALLVIGGLKALQSAAITTGLPFCLVMLLMCVALLRQLRRDHSASKQLGLAES